jgi:nucleoside-diphosphate-sugar epimerase
VLVTGAAGRFGPWVVSELRQRGYQVVAADVRQRSTDVPRGIHLERFGLYDQKRLSAALEGCAGVIHLAAFNSPVGRRPELVFRNNTGTTVSVLEAAARAGVSVAVIASSTSVLGLTYAPTPISPRYVPIDEAHPLDLLDPYALSKAADEQTALAVHRRTGMAVLALRFHWVAPPDAAAERAKRVAAEPAIAAREVWGYVDARDAATACRLALEHSEIGYAVLNIVAADSLATTPTVDLIRRYHPTTKIRRGVSGHRSAWSSEQARRLIGYEPQFSWRTEHGPPFEERKSRP